MLNLAGVTHLPAHLLPMSPVYTGISCWGSWLIACSIARNAGWGIELRYTVNGT